MQLDQQRMLMEFRLKEGLNPEITEEGLRPTAQLAIGWSVVFCWPGGYVGDRNSDRSTHQHDLVECPRGGRGKHCYRDAWDCLAAGWTRIGRSEGSLSATRSHLHRGASRPAAHGRHCLCLACRCSKRRQSSKHQEEQHRDRFGEETHASSCDHTLASSPDT